MHFGQCLKNCYLQSLKYCDKNICLLCWQTWVWSSQLRAEIHCNADVDVALLLPARGTALLFIRTTRCFYPLQGSPIPNLLGWVLVVENLSSKTQSKRGTKYTRAMFYLFHWKNNLNYHQCPSAQLCLSVQFLKPDSPALQRGPIKYLSNSFDFCINEGFFELWAPQIK